MSIQKSLKYDLTEDDILYFLHIPKTAGTTLTTILDNHFDLDAIYPEQVWQKLLNKPINFSKYKLIRGHFGHSLQRILPKKPVCITMIRDPIERTLSFYNHLRTDPFTNNWVIDFISNESLDSLISNPRKKLIFTNEQARHVGLDVDVLSITKPLTKLEIENFFYESSVYFTNPYICDEALIKTAIQNLSEFAFVGLTERFEESLMLLCYTFGWRPIRKVWKEMILPGRPDRNELSDKTVNLISECTRLDFELYQYAKELFELRFSQMVKELKEKYYEPHFYSMPFLQMIYEMLEKNYNEHFINSKKIQSSINFDFRQQISGSNWYAREFLSDGTVIRWMGIESSATIDFHLIKNTDLKIQFCVALQIAEDILKGLKLYVNDVPIDIKMSNLDNATVFEGVIEKEILQKMPITRITFEVNHTVSPKSINPASNDERQLGLAFSWIKIIPEHGTS